MQIICGRTWAVICRVSHSLDDKRHALGKAPPIPLLSVSCIWI